MTSATARAEADDAVSYGSVGQTAQSATIVANVDDVVPDPPTVEERDLYLGPQHRWVALLSFVGTMLTIVSVLYFVGNQPWSAFLLVPLAISVLGALMSLFTSLRRRRDSLDSHRGVVATWAPERHPSVDVFLPTAGESLAVLRNTYTHVSRLEWRGQLRVMVLDDSARHTVRDLSEEFGFEYHTRPHRGHLKKAGNLRYGFDTSDGDIITILDADFVPRADYLYELAPYLEDPTVGIVQSPQYFDTAKSMNWVQYAAGSTQILFYRWIQAARDTSDAAICVGTCALYRRIALQACGGFPEIGHSEDVYTGINLIAVGYRVRYVPTVVSKGLCPDTLNQFITQQYRWCTGSISLMLDRRFHSLPLTRMQRLSYWSGFLYYISTALDIFIVTLPPILLATFSPDRVQIRNYIFVLLALVVRQSVVPIITLGRDSLISLTRIQTTYAFAHAVALFDAVRGHTDAWVATGAAASSPTPVRVVRLVRVWVLTTQILLWAVLLWRAPHYGWGNYAPIAVFDALNLLIIYPIARNAAQLPQLLDPMTIRRQLRGALE